MFGLKQGYREIPAAQLSPFVEHVPLTRKVAPVDGGVGDGGAEVLVLDLVRRVQGAGVLFNVRRRETALRPVIPDPLAQAAALAVPGVAPDAGFRRRRYVGVLLVPLPVLGVLQRAVGHVLGPEYVAGVSKLEHHLRRARLLAPALVQQEPPPQVAELVLVLGLGPGRRGRLLLLLVDLAALVAGCGCGRCQADEQECHQGDQSQQLHFEDKWLNHVLGTSRRNVDAVSRRSIWLVRSRERSKKKESIGSEVKEEVTGVRNSHKRNCMAKQVQNKVRIGILIYTLP